MKERAWDLSGQ